MTGVARPPAPPPADPGPPGDGDRLGRYRARRDPRRTPEPVPAPGPLPQGRDDTFVVQEHHARRLHWDFRLERGGVLVSWAVPKGLPPDPGRNHLAVRTEDHPLSYAGFEGEIPAGEYGGGRVTIWDQGTYRAEKWTDGEVKVTLAGQRVRGRYVLFRTQDESWMVHRMDPPELPGWQPLPDLVRPMLAVPGELPPPGEQDRWGYEMKWDGVRAVGYVDGGRLRLRSRSGKDVTDTYPELAGLGAQLGTQAAVLDGEVVAFDAAGRVSFGALQPRMQVTDRARARRLAAQAPVTYLVFDLLHLDGADLTGLPYVARRERLEALGLTGPHWAVPPVFLGTGSEAVAASREQHLEGVVAKRLDAPYEPGRRSPAWRKVKNMRTQEVVVGGWRPGAGRRAGGVGSLLLGVPGPEGLRYVGHVGTGFTAAMLDEVADRLRPLAQPDSPFAGELPRADARDAQWVRPELVGEVRYAERTRDGRLRHPSWRGWRPDKRPDEVVEE